MRGGRDSNGNEYAMNMIILSNEDELPDEPPTPEVITHDSPEQDNEEAIQRQQDKWRQEAQNEYSTQRPP